MQGVGGSSPLSPTKTGRTKPRKPQRFRGFCFYYEGIISCRKNRFWTNQVQLVPFYDRTIGTLSIAYELSAKKMEWSGFTTGPFRKMQMNQITPRGYSPINHTITILYQFFFVSGKHQPCRLVYINLRQQEHTNPLLNRRLQVG